MPTIGDLVALDQRLDIYCHNHDCWRNVRWPPAEAVKRLGTRRTFAEASRILTCSACGARGRDGKVSARGDIRDYYWRFECGKALREGREAPPRPD